MWLLGLQGIENGEDDTRLFAGNQQAGT